MTGAPDSPLRLAERIRVLPPVERAIVEALVDRLELGLGEYGPWPRPAEEDRDLERETLEEVVDGLAYAGAALLRHRGEVGP